LQFCWQLLLWLLAVIVMVLLADSAVAVLLAYYFHGLLVACSQLKMHSLGIALLFLTCIPFHISHSTV